jgi:hypothetical protein
MANAYRLRLGRYVRYRTASGKWIHAAVIAVTSQTAIRLAVPRYLNGPNYANSPLTAAAGVNGQMTQLNANNDVNKMTAETQTNVWKPY